MFCALPHGESQRIVPELRARVGLVVDLAADFRLKDAALYPQWYGEEHGAPELLGRGRLRAARAVPRRPRRRHARGGRRLLPDGGRAGPGPAGAGRARSSRPASWSTPRRACRARAAALKESLHFGTVDEDFTAYGLLTHRHTPEMEQIIGGEVLFTPHLAPMVRGILATCYARPAAGTVPTTDAVMAALHDAYDAEPFVVVTDDAAVDQGHVGLQRRPRDGAGRPPHRLGGRRCAPSTTW